MRNILAILIIVLNNGLHHLAALDFKSIESLLEGVDLIPSAVEQFLPVLVLIEQARYLASLVRLQIRAVERLRGVVRVPFFQLGRRHTVALIVSLVVR